MQRAFAAPLLAGLFLVSVPGHSPTSDGSPAGPAGSWLPPVHRAMLERLSAAPDAERPAACWAPGSDPRIQGVFEDLAGPTGGENWFQFSDNSRWSTTATDGSGLGQGDPTTVTWSIVPDGTTISSGVGEPVAASNLVAWLDARYGAGPGGSDLTQRPWFIYLEFALQEWENGSAVRFVYEPGDDGVTLPSGAGVLGVRGDVRIGGKFIDGNSNTLAYNYFPNTGDMVIDTGDGFFGDVSNQSLKLRNVVSHEAGHGLGFFHVCPVNLTKLMEPEVTTFFTGPQFDDLLAVNRGYGDGDEWPGGNDVQAAAVPVGPVNPGQFKVRTHSVDDNSDEDWFSFTVPSGTGATVTLTPSGVSYLEDGQNPNGSCPGGSSFDPTAQGDIALELYDTSGSGLIASSDAGGAGTVETVTVSPLPDGAGTYFIRVTGSTNRSQLIQLRIDVASAGEPELEAAPASVTFSSVALGDSADTKIVFRNTGTLDLDITSVTGCGTGDYTLDLSPLVSPVPPGDSTCVRVVYVPTGPPTDCTVTVDSDGGQAQIPVTVGTVTAVGDGPGRPVPARVLPNPFTASAEVRFRTAAPGPVSLTVYDFRGRRVRAVPGGVRPAGEHGLRWDGLDGRGVPAAAGIYFLRLATPDGAATLRAVRLR